MVDKSWGLPPARSSGEARKPIEPLAREPLTARLDARASARAAQAAQREAERLAKREANVALAARDPHAAAAQRHRGSGRKDVVREQRDTSGYRMVADEARIRMLASRGASPQSLADVLGLPIETIRQALADAE